MHLSADVRCLVLATDYDGTLATEGRVSGPTLSALRRLGASGRKLVLVTGRQLGDLMERLPEHDLFDLVVAENGALLYRPRDDKAALLAPEANQAFVAALKQRKVQPLDVGRCIVATREPHQREMFEVIGELGLVMSLILNKGAVMALPPGVDKGSGLRAALRELGISAADAVAVGDAENDQALLASAGRGVAVGNALASLKERADLVTRGEAGAGVEELIDRLLKASP